MSLKYFRTYHVPWSAGCTRDDKMLASVDHLLGREIVVTEKIDGENETWTEESIFARSHDGAPTHSSNNWAKAHWAASRHLIDPGLSVFMEYTYALHSIWYREMARHRAYFHVIGVRDDITGVHWAWEDVEIMAGILGLPTVPVLYRGVVNSEKELRAVMPGTNTSPSVWGGVPILMENRAPVLAPGYTPDSNIREGEVVRIAAQFSDPDTAIAKAVRADHVQSDEHWKENWRPMHEWLPST